MLKTGAEVIVESGAGLEAGVPDAEYEQKGARIVSSRAEVFSSAAIVCMVRTYGANTETGGGDLELYRDDQTIVGLSEPLTELDPIQKIAGTRVRTFALELIPRTTRAQGMDVLSSQANVGGYKAVVIALNRLPKMLQQSLK